MKKVWLLAAILALSAWGTLAHAGCMGPFCFDDTAAYVNGKRIDGNGTGVPVVSSVTIAGLTPYIGQTVICNTCATNSSTNSYELCYATATPAASFVFASSSTKVCK